MDIPLQLLKGDSYTWTEDNTDYPAADGYTCSYVLISNDDKITLTAETTDEGYKFTINTNDLTQHNLGEYKAYLIFTLDGDRKTLDENVLVKLLPDPTDLSTYAEKSINEQILDAINAALLKLAVDGVVSFSINNRATTYTDPQKLNLLKSEYERKVRAEKNGTADLDTYEIGVYL